MKIQGILFRLPLSLLSANAERKNVSHFYIKKHTDNERDTHKYRESDYEGHKHVDIEKTCSVRPSSRIPTPLFPAASKHSFWAWARPSETTSKTTTRNSDKNQRVPSRCFSCQNKCHAPVTNDSTSGLQKHSKHIYFRISTTSKIAFCCTLHPETSQQQG